MPDNHLQNAVQATMQPFIKLVQANMTLLSKFSMLPSSATPVHAEGPIQMMQQGQEAATKALQSTAMLQLMQGLAKNYTEFMTEFSQTSLTALSLGQEAMVKQSREMSGKVAEATQAQARHVRAAAA
jgi:hypothetical protein